MKFYWTAKSFPELRGLSEEEKRDAYRRAHQRAMHDRRTIFSWVILTLALTVVNALLDCLLDWAGVSGVLRHVCTAGYCLAWGLFCGQFYMAGFARALREEQQTHAADLTNGS